MKNCRLIEFHRIGSTDVGYLTPLEGNKNIPFDIKRVYYIYDVPTEIPRGFHAHRKLEQVLFCLQGSVRVKVEDGEKTDVIPLDAPHKGLYVGPMVWHEMFDFEENTVMMVLASDYYEEKDYIRDYEEFNELLNTDII
ncbi:sugar 3,4-ketoisomerase [Natronincola ferrireducens]|uniref:WxcM-like, C-terminal n=1 Tax=Natronincola ferrireducens TaxID=393762 RepID=A0A1G8X2G9_9FIRM|nr:FdtA/QdtA family cupin domain-containing protein [Natronincola ferrireducens]SDJ84644.1 WxcM-like, C-terminal [Natronincola ferrireducens]